MKEKENIVIRLKNFKVYLKINMLGKFMTVI